MKQGAGRGKELPNNPEPKGSARHRTTRSTSVGAEFGEMCAHRVVGNAVHAGDLEIHAIAIHFGVRHVAQLALVHVLQVHGEAGDVAQLARTLVALEVLGHLVLNEDVFVLKDATAGMEERREKRKIRMGFALQQACKRKTEKKKS